MFVMESLDYLTLPRLTLLLPYTADKDTQFKRIRARYRPYTFKTVCIWSAFGLGKVTISVLMKQSNQKRDSPDSMTKGERAT